MSDKLPPTHIRKRLPVSVSDDDYKLYLALKHHLEQKAGEGMSLADLVRLAMRTLAEQEGVRVA